jgi:hypothetical protein
VCRFDHTQVLRFAAEEVQAIAVGQVIFPGAPQTRGDENCSTAGGLSCGTGWKPVPPRRQLSKLTQCLGGGQHLGLAAAWRSQRGQLAGEKYPKLLPMPLASMLRACHPSGSHFAF